MRKEQEQQQGQMDSFTGILDDSNPTPYSSLHSSVRIDTNATSSSSSTTTNIIFITTGYDQVIKFWDPLNGTCTRTIPYPESHINCMSLSADKKHLAVGSNPNARIFDVGRVGINTPTIVYQGHKGNITGIGCQQDFKWIFTVSEDRRIKIWDTRSPKAQRDYVNSSPINSAVLHPNQGEIYTVDQKGSLKIWDLIPEENSPAQSISVSSDGTLAVIGNYTGNCYLWKVLTNAEILDLKPISFISAHKSFITKVLLSPDSMKLATASKDGTIKIWSTADYSLLQTLQGHSRWVWDVAFSADSAYLVSASSDQTARLWDVKNGGLIRPYTGHEKALTALVLNDFVENIPAI